MKINEKEIEVYIKPNICFLDGKKETYDAIYKNKTGYNYGTMEIKNGSTKIWKRGIIFSQLQIVPVDYKSFKEEGFIPVTSIKNIEYSDTEKAWTEDPSWYDLQRYLDWNKLVKEGFSRSPND